MLSSFSSRRRRRVSALKWSPHASARRAMKSVNGREMIFRMGRRGRGGAQARRGLS
jgi:hypothetical protein